MKDKVCVVTGANSGVGFQASLLLAQLGGTVVLVCRDRSRGETALNQITTRVPSADVRLEVKDLADLGQVRELGSILSTDNQTIDLLVNNAGVYRASLERTADGFEQTMAVNHLSHFLLTHLLLCQLLAGSGRVINVSSEAHRRGRLDSGSLEDTLRGRSRYSGMGAYSYSKLANILFTSELARRYRPDELTACAVHPGVLATRIWNQNMNPLSLFMVLLKPIMGRPSVGGEAVAFLAQKPAEAVHGRYFNKKWETNPSTRAQDQGLARDLWDVSLALTGLESDAPAAG